MNALATLLSHPAIWRGNQLGNVGTPSLPTGFAALDAALPGGGWSITAAFWENWRLRAGIFIRWRYPDAGQKHRH